MPAKGGVGLLGVWIKTAKNVADSRPRAERRAAGEDGGHEGKAAPIRKGGADAGLDDIPESERTPAVRAAIARTHAVAARLREDLFQAERRLRELEDLADRDTLAPVLNRRAFMREMTRMVAFCRRYNVPASVVYFDMNGFKAINDAHGHTAGDKAIVHVSRVLAAQIRESDLLGRIGGDEFAIVLAHADAAAATAKARMLADVIGRTPMKWDGKDLYISAEFGVCEFAAGLDADRMLAIADEAMYRNKKASDIVGTPAQRQA